MYVENFEKANQKIKAQLYQDFSFFNAKEHWSADIVFKYF